MFATARRGENRSKSYFILGIRRKKFPNSNPKAKSAPTLYFSRNFPLFPAISRFQTHPSNINRQAIFYPQKKNARGFGSARFNLPSRRNPSERFKKNDRAPRAKKTIYQSTAVYWFEDLAAAARKKPRPTFRARRKKSGAPPAPARWQCGYFGIKTGAAISKFSPRGRGSL